MLFNAAFAAAGIDASYTRVAASDMREAMLLFRMIGFRGMNVTAPFKRDMYAAVEVPDEDASAIGAVNTVVRDGTTLRGFNTDSLAVAESLSRAGVRLRGTRCLVLGAGGAGAAAAYGLVRCRARVTVANRTPVRAVEVAKRCGCVAAGFDALEAALATTDILVSALPDGINVIAEQWLRPGTVVLDANYTYSSLLESARRRGCAVVSGEEWLINQAGPAFELFTGIEPDMEVMRRALNNGAHLEERRSTVALVGFMGCGKTAVGRALADLLGYTFIDTDAAVEEREGRTVAEIFAAEGEHYFREREKLVLAELISRKGIVIACGGGVVLDGKNRSRLAEHSLVVWLYASPETCVARTKPGTRPLLEGGDRFEIAGGLLHDRISHYARVSDLVVNGEGEPEDVARKIAHEIGETFQD